MTPGRPPVHPPIHTAARPRRRGLVLTLALAIVAVLAGGAAGPAATAAASTNPLPAVRSCPDASVRVAARDPRDRAAACDGARDALQFFEALDLRRPDTIWIDVVDAMPPQVGDKAAGCWLRERDRAMILTFAAFRRAGRWFGVPIDRRLHRSVATHETAHALATCNFARPDPPVQAAEYVAYVTLFETMDPAQRTRALAAYPDAGFDDEARINTMVYLFDPMRFGVRAWRHYRAPGNGPAFLKRVLAGEAITE